MGKVRGRRVELVDRLNTVSQIQEACESGSRVASACKAAGISTRTFERWRSRPDGDQRRGPIKEPHNKLRDNERSKIIEVCNSKEYRDKAPSQIVPLLADKGVYIASESSFYRVLKAKGLDAHRQRSKPASRARPKELTSFAPNQVYSWDITYLKSEVRGMFFYLYVFMDVFSRKIVGFEVYEEQSSVHAARLVEDICKLEGIEKDQLYLHSDNGGPMKGATMLAKLQSLGVMPSFSRPSVSDDNPYSESLFRTLKYCPQYPSKPFATAHAAREWTKSFVHWYNEEHLHSGINFVTPGSRHRGEDARTLKRRHDVYQKAKAKNPTRWSGKTRNWNHIKKVFLNHLKPREASATKNAA